MKLIHSLGIALLLLCGLVGSSDALAQAQWLEYSVIHKDTSHRCITAKPDVAPGAAAPVTLVPCSLEMVVGEQAWGWIKADVRARGGLEVYAFQNVAAKTCLGVEGGVVTDRARLLTVRCDLTDPSQLWLPSMRIRSAVTAPGATKWVNLKSHKCIDVGDEGELRQSKCQMTAPYWPQEFTAPRR
ncbi:MAG TPA: hypothetical protein VM469_10215 [Pseudoxanthomonas sp.]|jgi:hypothetical protein|nr:hypothetical protein [Pseudoxanthomonas sp.]